MQGILFVEDLFLKVVTGHKTETRRTGGLDLINKQPNVWKDDPAYCDNLSESEVPLIRERYKKKRGLYFIFSSLVGWAIVRPRYQPGEILYLKEPVGRINGHLFRAYDYPPTSKMRTEFKGWGNKMFMRADDARFKIQITDVKIQRAQEITEEDAVREGCKNLAEFQTIWMRINGISSWKINPWVFTYSFKRV